VRIAEFENVEFLPIDIPFELINVEVDLTDDTLDEATDYKEDEAFTINVEEKKVADVMDEYIAFSLMNDDGGDEDYVDFV
jgi:hypothetical protein